MYIQNANKGNKCKNRRCTKCYDDLTAYCTKRNLPDLITVEQNIL